MKQKYEKYMRRAIELAARGWGAVSPNPMVGAVIVKDGRIIGEGFHEGPGRDHAEIMAFKNSSGDVSGADIVVNLEPCCYFGRTPPCTKAIIKNKIRRVIYGIRDPNGLVDGKGVQELKGAGIGVIGPLMEDECRAVNRIYINWAATKMPFVISKVALSLDGKIALANGKSKWITGEKCRARMHYWRSGVDAVLVGAGTVRQDNPRLDARGVNAVRQPRPERAQRVEGPRPVVATATGNIGTGCVLLGRRPIIIAPDIRCDHLRKKGAEVINAGKEKIDWKIALEKLGGIGIMSLLVEGGAGIHSQFMAGRLAHYMIASMSLRLLGAAGKEWLPAFSSESVDASPRVKPDQILVLDNDIVVEGEIEY